MIKYSWFPKGTGLLNLIFSFGDNASICVHVCVGVSVIEGRYHYSPAAGQMINFYDYSQSINITKRWKENTISESPN